MMGGGTYNTGGGGGGVRWRTGGGGEGREGVTTGRLGSFRSY